MEFWLQLVPALQQGWLALIFQWVYWTDFREIDLQTLDSVWSLHIQTHIQGSGVSMDAWYLIISNYHKYLKWRDKRKLEFFQIVSLNFLLKKFLPFQSAKTVLSDNLDGLNKLVLKQHYSSKVKNGATALWTHTTGHTSYDTGYKKRSRSCEG